METAVMFLSPQCNPPTVIVTPNKSQSQLSHGLKWSLWGGESREQTFTTISSFP